MFKYCITLPTTSTTMTSSVHMWTRCVLFAQMFEQHQGSAMIANVVFCYCYLVVLDHVGIWWNLYSIPINVCIYVISINVTLHRPLPVLIKKKLPQNDSDKGLIESFRNAMSLF